jgi:hypothetical protein
MIVSLLSHQQGDEAAAKDEDAQRLLLTQPLAGPSL